MRPLLLLAAVTACSAEAPSTDAPTEDDPIVADDAPAPAACTATTTVVVYPPNEVRTITTALAAHADPCTDYQVVIPALADTPRVPRPVPAWFRALGPRFHALAEFHYGVWHDWVHLSSGTRSMELAGKDFRRAMVLAGYDIAAGDSWVLQELPGESRTSAAIRAQTVRAMKGLFEGDGTHVRGVALLFPTSQTNAGIASGYRPALEGMLSDTAFWQAAATYLRWFGSEVYADPHDNCISGEAIATRSADLGAFLVHLPRLAAAGGTRSATAAAFLRTHWFPLFNAAWNTNVGYGDNRVTLDAFARFQRLEVYATHVWAAHHDYPGRRLGFAWRPDGAPADRQLLANELAAAIQRAYPAGGFANLAVKACSAGGDVAFCSCSVPGAARQPQWELMGTW